MRNYLRKNIKKEPWQIAAARYCATNSEDGFTKEELGKYIKSLYGVSEAQLDQFHEEEIYQPTGRTYNRRWSAVDGINKWTAPLDLVSKITDYDELQEARESSRKAMYIATVSLVVAIVVGIAQIWTSIEK